MKTSAQSRTLDLSKADAAAQLLREHIERTARNITEALEEPRFCPAPVSPTARP